MLYLYKYQMRWNQIKEAAMPFGRLGNTTGMTFGFESEFIVHRNYFAEEVHFDIDDRDELIENLNIDEDDFDTKYAEWQEDNEGDISDWIKDVGLENWWNELHVHSFEYGVLDDSIVSYPDWSMAIDYYAENIREEFGIELRTAYREDAGIENKDYDDWHMEGDASISVNAEGDYAFEIISPVYHDYAVFAQALKDWLEWMPGASAYTNRSTGLHVNIGIPNANTKIDPLKLLLFSGEKWVAQHWRQDGNGYTDELLPMLTTDGLPRSTADAAKITRTFIEGLNEKSFAINFLTLIEKDYVEFRPIGNANYEHRVSETFDHISKFVQVIQIAADPTMYAREYAKKLGKLIGGDSKPRYDNLPFEIKKVIQWLDTTNLSDSSKENVVRDGKVVIDASALIRLVNMYTVPPIIVKLLIKLGGLTKADYIAAVEYLNDRGWIIDNIDAAKAILDPIFGV